MAEDDVRARALLLQVWNQLPAFRSIAETEHLPTAGHRAHVSPSALSRALSLLEARLGRALFEREGRRLKLNDFGRSLLAGICAAEEAVCRAVMAEAPAPRGAELRVATMGQLARTHLAPALSSQPVPVTVSDSPRDAACAALSRGEVDLLLGYDCEPRAGLDVTPLPSPPLGIYVSRQHPAFAAPSLDSLLRVDFVAPPPGGAQGIWPSRPRRIGLFVEDAHLAMQLCLTGRYGMAMSTASARAFVTTGQLRGVQAPFLPTPRLSVVTRKGHAGSRWLVSRLERVAQEYA